MTNRPSPFSYFNKAANHRNWFRGLTDRLSTLQSLAEGRDLNVYVHSLQDHGIQDIYGEQGHLASFTIGVNHNGQNVEYIFGACDPVHAGRYLVRAPGEFTVPHMEIPGNPAGYYFKEAEGAWVQKFLDDLEANVRHDIVHGAGVSARLDQNQPKGMKLH
jgi:hypothetical protein